MSSLSPSHWTHGSWPARLGTARVDIWPGGVGNALGSQPALTVARASLRPQRPAPTACSARRQSGHLTIRTGRSVRWISLRLGVLGEEHSLPRPSSRHAMLVTRDEWMTGKGSSLYRGTIPVAGPDTQDAVQRAHPDLPVTDRVGPGVLGEGLDQGVRAVIGDH